MILAAFFPNNAGYVYRVENWVKELKAEGFEVEVAFGCEENEFIEFKGNHNIQFYIRWMHRRFNQVLKARKFDLVIVRREILLFNDYGNLFYEKLLLAINKNVVLDFDDDIC